MEIEKANERTVITFNADKNALSILAMTFLLILPLYCTWTVFREPPIFDDSFPIAVSILCLSIHVIPILWLFWKAITTIAWVFYGKVNITIDKDKMIFGSKAFGRFRKPWEYDLKKINNIRIIPGEDYKKYYLSYYKGLRRAIAVERMRNLSHNVLLFDYEKFPTMMNLPRLEQGEKEEILNIIADYKDISQS